jgi:predicted amidophosphoribosyltransferase
LRERGWDQVEDLARELERLGFAVARLLSRSSPGQQKRLGRAARSENARASYALLPRARVPSEVVLLDDVITTGATAGSCATALKAGGAESVALLTLAAD